MTKQQIGTFKDMGRLLAFSISFVASVVCADTAWNNPNGPHVRMVDKWPRERIAALIDDLMAAPPAK